MYKKPPILDWFGIYDEKELENAIKKRELKHIYAWVSGACDLNCIYCQTKSGSPQPGEMTIDERKKLMDDFKELWGELVHIAGRWEPTVDPVFWEQLEYMWKLWLKPVIYTHWANIWKDEAKKFKRVNASIILKIHSLDENLQDWFAATKWYTKKRNIWLKHLIDEDFNKWTPTKLGADILVMRKNFEEIEEIFCWCRDNNIFPLVKPFLTNERWASTFVKENLQIDANMLRELYTRLSEIDKKKYWYDWTPSPPYAWIHCNYYFYHIMVTIMWDAAPCIWLPYIWNIRDKSLKDLWEHEQVEKVRNILKYVWGACKTCELHKKENCYGCPCRKVYKKWKDALFEGSNCFEDIV